MAGHIESDKVTHSLMPLLPAPSKRGYWLGWVLAWERSHPSLDMTKPSGFTWKRAGLIILLVAIAAIIFFRVVFPLVIVSLVFVFLVWRLIMVLGIVAAIAWVAWWARRRR